MKIKLLVDGGKMAPGPAVAQQLGPLGINMGKVISDVNEATKSFSGIKVPVELDIDTKTKNVEIKVLSPPVAELIKKEINLDKGSGKSSKIKSGNVAIETLIKVAKTKQQNLLVNDLKAALLLVVGTCQSLGLLIDSKEPREMTEAIKNGNFDKEIKAEKTEPSEEKLKELNDFYKQVETKQAAEVKAAKEAEEAAKK